MFLAHLKWFESGEGLTPETLMAGQWWFVIFFVLGGVLALLAIDHFTVRQNKLIGTKLTKLHPYVPTAVGVTIGLSLIFHSLNGVLFAPNIPVSMATWRLAEFVIGGLLVVGLKVRWAAYGLLALFIISLIFVPAISLLEHLEYIGAAVFLVVMASGRGTLDYLLQMPQKAIKEYEAKALQFLQVTVGISLIILAFSEKLSNLALADKFLQTHQWNLLAIVGASNHQFIIFAGACELIFGIALVLNIAPRLVILLLGGLMALTAAVLDPLK